MIHKGNEILEKYPPTGHDNRLLTLNFRAKPLRFLTFAQICSKTGSASFCS